MPPSAGTVGALARPRLDAAFAAATGSHRITVVDAPAGYGKTTALAGWVRRSGVPYAWLAVDRFDAGPARLFRRVVASLQAAAERLPLPDRTSLLALEHDLDPDPARSYDRVLETLGNLTEPVVLVLDDLHLPGRKVGTGILGVLAVSGPSSLRLVFSSRGVPPLPVERIRHGKGVSDLRMPDLAFTRDEARQLAASLGPTATGDVDALWNEAAGWPVALHRSLEATARISGPGARAAPDPPPGTALTGYVAEEVLDQLPHALADFVLRATITDRISRRLAVELSAKPGGGHMLHDCLRRSLFIEEREGPGGESAYRWHPLFASQCRHILEERDPLLHESLHRIAARHHQDTDVVACVAHALRGRDPLRAVAALGAHWLEFVLRDDTEALEGLCLELPYPWSDDAEILAVRSACRSLAGDAASAADLLRRAQSRAHALDAERHKRFHTSHGLFELFVGERRPDLRTAADAGRRLLDADSEGMWALQAAGVFLLGQAEVRLQRDGAGAIHLLRTAAAAGAANRLEAVEVCSSAELALGLAVAGDLVAAQEAATHALERATIVGWQSQGQLAPAWLAQGIAGYWRNDAEEAAVHLSRGIRAGHGAFPLGALLRLYRVLADCTINDPTRLAEAHADLEATEDWEAHGLPGTELHTVAAAKVAEAMGDLDRALGLVRPLVNGGTSPLVTMLVTELLRRGGEGAAARRGAQSLAATRGTPYIDTGLALTEALLADAAGDSATAHERVEHAAAVAERQSILRPFIERSADLEDLLTRHLAWGTAHESFIAARTAQHGHDHTHRPPSYWALTERELEVLTYMRSMMTAADIAKGLFVSVNTVKTHQRSIYRKLGVASRREALRIAVERGLT
ncbi:LuxR C-terminal-related transcriptional regulator [Arthrobacter ginkgonis]|uniref:LuxR C-terminal-related transcriptional regulator n=1 Tax=Arthrobacter ginkgonis TaxID=1630594 RepID=A0ABP7CI87_9MICC